MLFRIRMKFRLFISIFFLLAFYASSAKKQNGQAVVDDLTDMKDFKKLLRTKNNVLVLYTSIGKDTGEIVKVTSEVANKMKGEATVVYMDCNGEAKKLCKKLKITPETYTLKHYKDGEFNKDYDRKETVQSLVNFLKDPTGDIPWEEDTAAIDVIHVPDGPAFAKLLRKEASKPMMMMFYAPWCGFCKRLKPDFAAAATELRGQVLLGAMDVNKPENAIVRQHFNITGFPTMLYFEDGNLKYKYEGENTKQGIVDFMRNPTKQPPKPTEQEWSETPSHVVHLTDATFETVLSQHASVIVMFYAPWCGHCKSMKPEYTAAAKQMKDENIAGILAAMDATKETAVAKKFNIKGYPSVKYFRDGVYAFDVDTRTSDKIIEFMKDPKEPPPPPPPEKPWHETESDVFHLNEENFVSFLKRKKHVLVMFYAPWCGHCKKAKPEFMAAASQLKEDPKVAFSAVDCTIHSTVCKTNDVRGYPTIKYFNYYKTSKPYEGGRTEADFVEFMKDPQKADSYTPPVSTPKEVWGSIPGAENLHHLTDSTFNTFIQQQDSALVMFYAPWCGHCNKMKPAYAEAATELKESKISGVLATVDGTVEKVISDKYEIQSYPTIKYFRNGVFVAKYDRARTKEDIVAFMKKPPTSSKEEL